MSKVAAVVLWVWITAFSASPALAARGYDVADLWWTPSEPGWGLQLVQQNTTVFATMYVYDQYNVPYWYTALMSFSGFNAQGGPIYSGPLNQSTGPYWAGFYNPAQFQTVPVGTMTFNSPTTATAVLTYTVNGVPIVKNVERFTLAYENFNGDYIGTYIVKQSGCLNPAYNGTYILGTTFSVTQSSSAMSIVGAMTNGISNFVCTFSGAYTPRGSIGSFSGNYICSTGESGTVGFAEMNVERFDDYWTNFHRPQQSRLYAFGAVLCNNRIVVRPKECL